MERRASEKGLPRVLIQTYEDVVLRTTRTLAPKERGKEGFFVAVDIAIKLGAAMREEGRVLK